MKGRVFTAVITLCLLFGMMFPKAAAAAFSDVPADSWYTAAVSYVRDNGLMNGTSDTAFSPDGTMTRAMLVTALHRAAGTPSVPMQPSYTDVPAAAWYSDAAAWAALEGLAGGYGDGRFGPDDPVSREQAAVILWRYAGRPQAQSAGEFTDESAIASWAADAVDWAWSSGIFSGRNGDVFSPQAGVTRAEAAAALCRCLTGGQEYSGASSSREVRHP